MNEDARPTPLTLLTPSAPAGEAACEGDSCLVQGLAPAVETPPPTAD
ncbi:MAG: hypothetical protein RJQ01_07830 [Microcella sp.]